MRRALILLFCLLSLPSLSMAQDIKLPPSYETDEFSLFIVRAEATFDRVDFVAEYGIFIYGYFGKQAVFKAQKEGKYKIVACGFKDGKFVYAESFVTVKKGAKPPDPIIPIFPDDELLKAFRKDNGTKADRDKIAHVYKVILKGIHEPTLNEYGQLVQGIENTWNIHVGKGKFPETRKVINKKLKALYDEPKSKALDEMGRVSIGKSLLSIVEEINKLS